MYKVWGGGDFPDLISHLIMPSIALALVATGVIARIARNAVLEILRQDFIRTARAKGVKKIQFSLNMYYELQLLHYLS